MRYPSPGLGCYRCLCEACNHRHCKLRHNWRYRIDFCYRMHELSRCPVIKCDYFQHKQKKKCYKIVRREKRADLLLSHLEELNRKLDALGDKLT